ncbi:hypothetical protein O6H91_Y539900 [Diphasiastrum complanatum]|nr:hypothetical protein O6H91_Y539900 [Diphasiastrum complanatum]
MVVARDRAMNQYTKISMAPSKNLTLELEYHSVLISHQLGIAITNLSDLSAATFNNEHIERAYQLLDEHYKNVCTLAIVCKKFSISDFSYFCEVFACPPVRILSAFFF